MSNKETEFKQMLTQLVEVVKRKNNSILFFFFKGQIEMILEKGMDWLLYRKMDGNGQKVREEVRILFIDLIVEPCYL